MIVGPGSWSAEDCQTSIIAHHNWRLCILPVSRSSADRHVDISAYDPKTLRLYVTMHQIFRIWIIPFFSAAVTLTTLLQLVEEPYPTPHHPNKRSRYFIQSQNDLYQANEWIKFASPFGVLSLLVLTWQLIATGFCVLGAVIFWPVSWVEQNMIGGNDERSIKDVLQG